MPNLIHPEGIFLVSTYNMEELEAMLAYININFNSPRKNYFKLAEAIQLDLEGVILGPDSLTAIFVCNPELQAKQAIAHSDNSNMANKNEMKI